MNENTLNEYLTTDGAARILNVSPQRVSQLIAAGELEATKASGIWLITRESVEARAALKRKGGRPRRGYARNEVRFTLKNRTHDIVELVYNTASKSFTWMGEVMDASRVPIGVLRGFEPPSVYAFNRWWEGRGIPETREGLLQNLISSGAVVPPELIARNLGLSLSDQYWICPQEADLHWEDINFFQHDFEEVAEATQGYVPKGTSGSAHPDNTTNGNLGKTWVIQDGVRMLLKEGRNLNQEPYNEVVATLLHKRLLKPGEYVPYTLQEHDGRMVSACPIFLSDEEEYIPALYVDQLLDESPHLDEYHHYLACCEELGVKDAELALWKIIVCDDVLANPDRHWRNFGIVRNVETLECRPAPIFDSGEGLWCNTSYANLKRGEFSFSSHMFYPSPAQQLLLVESMGWFEPEAFDGFLDEAMDLLAQNEALEERLPYVRSSLDRRIYRIRDLREWE